MSPQTYRTIKNGERTGHSAARTRARTGTVLRHEMGVVASSVADVVASVGGWVYDRRMAGWQVNVLLPESEGQRALRILGANVLDLRTGLEAIADDPDRAATVVVAADVYTAHDRVRRLISRSDSGRTEVALWGDTGSLGVDVSAVSYRLSAAARAFKSQALLAAGVPSGPVGATEVLFRCGVSTLPPVLPRS